MSAYNLTGVKGYQMHQSPDRSKQLNLAVLASPSHVQDTMQQNIPVLCWNAVWYGMAHRSVTHRLWQISNSSIHAKSIPGEPLPGVPSDLQDLEQCVRQPGWQQLDDHPNKVDAVKLSCLMAHRHCAFGFPRASEDSHLCCNRSPATVKTSETQCNRHGSNRGQYMPSFQTKV